MSALIRTVIVIALAVLVPAQSLGQNSGKKIRKEPSPMAARAGSAVQWRANLETALAEARESNKPVFWYVPTIRRSPMDRTREIDRYMLAGPFSWPRVTAFLNEHFIPVRMVAGKAECATHNLRTFTFVEPGWLVLDGSGKEVSREHQITTFHPARFLAPLAAIADTENPAADGLPGDKQDAATALWLNGAEHWLSQRETEARAQWRALIEMHPDHPLAWKAAMELEGHGPLVHAFETYAELPARALQPNPEGTRAPAGVYGEDEIWERSVAFLLGSQRSSGGWEDSIYDFGGTDGLPNVYVAVSSICTIALLEYAARKGVPDPRVETALERALGYICNPAHINRDDTDEQFWAHAYLVRCLSRWIELRPHDRERVLPTLERASADLVAVQTTRGAWAHEYANPFATSDALIALAKAKAVGVLPEGLDGAVERGLASLLLCRTQAGAYTYGQPRRGKARAAVEGSVGRTPRGELAVELWSPEDCIGLEKAVTLSFDNEGHLLPAQKYDDHTPSYAYGGFFFYYDLHARTEAIAGQKQGSARRQAAQRQYNQFMGLPEFDGAFMDSHEVGRCYGTGMVLWSLGTLGSLGPPD